MSKGVHKQCQLASTTQHTLNDNLCEAFLVILQGRGSWGITEVCIGRHA